MTKPDQSEGDRARDEVLAGEYVLGVLSLEQRARVEARLRHDSAFAAIVARWEENLAPLDDEYQPIAPSPLVLPVIERRLFGGTGLRPPRGPLAAAWASVGLWRGLAFASFFLLVGTILFAERPAVAPSAAAELRADMQAQNADSLSLVARYDAAEGRLHVTPVAAGAAQQHSLELWLIRGNDPAISLGVLPQSGEGDVIVPQQLRGQIEPGITLAVSLEPYGGSPTGKATGPILALGQAHRP